MERLADITTFNGYSLHLWFLFFDKMDKLDKSYIYTILAINSTTKICYGGMTYHNYNYHINQVNIFSVVLNIKSHKASLLRCHTHYVSVFTEITCSTLRYFNLYCKTYKCIINDVRHLLVSNAQPFPGHFCCPHFHSFVPIKDGTTRYSQSVERLILQ